MIMMMMMMMVVTKTVTNSNLQKHLLFSKCTKLAARIKTVPFEPLQRLVF